MGDEYAQYSCSSDEADPVPEMDVSIKDQEGRSIEVQIRLLCFVLCVMSASLDTLDMIDM